MPAPRVTAQAFWIVNERCVPKFMSWWLWKIHTWDSKWGGKCISFPRHAVRPGVCTSRVRTLCGCSCVHIAYKINTETVGSNGNLPRMPLWPLNYRDFRVTRRDPQGGERRRFELGLYNKARARPLTSAGLNPDMQKRKKKNQQDPLWKTKT